MSQTIVSTTLGPLTQHADYSDWWRADAVAIPFFEGQRMPITYTCEPQTDPAFLAEADAAVGHFRALGPADREAVSGPVYANFQACLAGSDVDESGDLQARVPTQTDIWALVRPNEIYVSRRHRRDRDVYVQIDCACQWEDEHGLALVFRQGCKLTRVSQYDGHLTEADASDRPDEDDELLSAFGEK